MTIQDRYLANYSRIAQDDILQDFMPPWYREAQAKKILKYAGSLKGKHILDIGCGKGYLLRLIPHNHKFGIDICVEYIKLLQAVGIQAGVMDAETMPFEAQFDVAFMTDILEHVLNPQKVLERAYQVLNPRGLLIVRVPLNEDVSKYKDSKYEFTHLRSFSKKSLISLIQAHGFRNESIHYDGYTSNTQRPLPHFLSLWRNKAYNKKWLTPECIANLPNWIANLWFAPVEIVIVARKPGASVSGWIPSHGRDLPVK